MDLSLPCWGFALFVMLLFFIVNHRACPWRTKVSLHQVVARLSYRSAHEHSLTATKPCQSNFLRSLYLCRPLVSRGTKFDDLVRRNLHLNRPTTMTGDLDGVDSVWSVRAYCGLAETSPSWTDSLCGAICSRALTYTGDV